LLNRLLLIAPQQQELIGGWHLQQRIEDIDYHKPDVSDLW
jgi:hypothetical protein